MNEVIKAIIERRSIRNFSEEPVKDEDLALILKAASYTPTARNSQAWVIMAIQGYDRIAALDAKVKEASRIPGFDRYREFVSSSAYTINYKRAPVFMIVGADRKESFCPVEDGSLVIGSILLAAHSLGLGACWINQLGAVSDEPGFRKYLTGLGFPETHMLVGSVALGHRHGDNPRPPERAGGKITVIK